MYLLVLNLPKILRMMSIKSSLSDNCRPTCSLIARLAMTRMSLIMTSSLSVGSVSSSSWLANFCFFSIILIAPTPPHVDQRLSNLVC